MIRSLESLARFLLLIVLSWGSLASAQQPRPVSATRLLWQDPGDIRSRNLFWGIGGEESQPKLPVEFLEENMHGTNPKFDVRDAEGTKWHVKMAPEARPEVAASRLLWAVGYSANENYFLPMLHVDKMPPSLRRGNRLTGSNGDIPNVRLQRRVKHLKKVGNWNWRHNPFVGTREFNGLRVMMALIRNWDLNDNNNVVLENEKDPQQHFYEVTDLGVSFGSRGRHYHFRNSIGNFQEYHRRRLIDRAGGDTVDLHFPVMPPLSFIFDFSFYRAQMQAHWIGRNIPRADARWIGTLLAQLSPDQIRDAFRAAGYPPELVEDFTAVLISRIQELKNL